MAAIVDHYKVTESQKSGITVDADGNIKKTHSETWCVKIDVPVSPYVAAGMLSVQIGVTGGTPYGDDAAAFCMDIQPRCTDKGGLIHEVDFTYNTLSYKEQQRIANPLTRRPKISRSFEKIVIPADLCLGLERIDSSGTTIESLTGLRPITTSANDAYNPTIDQEIIYPKLTIVRNEAAWSGALYSLINKTNSGTFLGYSQYRVKCTNISEVEEIVTINDEDFPYHVVTYEFLFATLVPYWKRRLLDAGLRYLSGSGSGKQKHNILVKNQPVTEPTKLNGRGGQWVDGQPVVWNDFTMLYDADFSSLNLESLFT